MIYREKDFPIEMCDKIVPKSYKDEGGFSYYTGRDIEEICSSPASILCISNYIEPSLIRNRLDKIVIYCESPLLFFTKVCNEKYKRLRTPKYKICDYGNVVIYENVQLGGNVKLGNFCSIGQEGFGFVYDGKRYIQVPHFGGVEIGDDCNLGENVIIDCGTFGNTKIGNSVFIDNMCQIAHNVKIGDKTRVMAKVSISGGVEIGENCWIAPGAVIKNGVKIGDNCLIGIGSIVTIDVPSGKIYKPNYKEMFIIEDNIYW